MGDEKGNVWEKPDPRIQWALDVFDWEGTQPTTFNEFVLPVVGAAVVGFASIPFMNWLVRRPLFANIPLIMTGGLFGTFAGFKFREYQLERSRQILAVTKHYIMLHPELFPEPEKIKYGDAKYLVPWRPIR